MIARRRMLEGFVASATWLGMSRLVTAAALPLTPAQTTGPFYPLALPPDADNDLIHVAGRNVAAKGTVTYVSGRVFNPDGQPVGGARVEIWQCDANGHYHHVRDERAGSPIDENFQGYGQAITDVAGGYRFVTIWPVSYPGRTPHIHFAVSSSSFPRLVTQMYVAGEPQNERDAVLMSVRDPAARSRLVVPLQPTPGAETGVLAGTFDIVLG